MTIFPRLAAVAAMAVLAAPAGAARIDVMAAASLRTALDRIAAAWEGRTGDDIRIAYAGSPQLARQIEQGAPADIFISAAPAWMDYLDQRRLTDAATRLDLLGNRLVLIAAGGDAAPVDLAPGLDLARMLGDGRLAMALFDSVPAGVYGKAALTSLGLWDAVRPKVAQAENVRAALALVATGEASYGIVYATDARAQPGVTVVATFPADSHPPITYPAALTAAGAGDAQARAFFDALRQPAARAVFEAEGFAVAVP